MFQRYCGECSRECGNCRVKFKLKYQTMIYNCEDCTCIPCKTRRCAYVDCKKCELIQTKRYINAFGALPILGPRKLAKAHLYDLLSNWNDKEVKHILSTLNGVEKLLSMSSGVE